MFKRNFAWHPYLFALFPILNLYASNAHQVAPGEIVLPIIIVMLAVAGVTTSLNLPVKNLHKTSIIVTVGVIWFFSWGHILEIGPQLFRLESNPIRMQYNGIILIFACLCLGIISYFLYRSKKSPVKLTQVLNKIGLLLVALQICMAGWVLFDSEAVTEEHQRLSVTANTESELPDIYYLIVDGYARSDILADLFNYDNSQFLSHLREQGFYIADQSHSNYTQTLLSLTSTMNMNLIDQIATIDTSSNNRLGIKKLLSNNQLFDILHTNGYQIATFTSGYNMIEFNQIDITLRTWYNLSEFGGRLLETTPLHFCLARGISLYTQARDRLNYQFNTLSELDQLQSPFFVFAHILSPHPPFIYDSTGTYLEPTGPFDLADGSHFFERVGTKEEYLDGYSQQIKYITARLTQTIDRILETNSDNPPVILLQADHGSGSQLDWESVENTNVRERMSILNAYYLPGINDSTALYPTITPVNSFRVVLNEYLNAELPLVPDRSYYSGWSYPFQFHDVTDQLSVQGGPSRTVEAIASE